MKKLVLISLVLTMSLAFAPPAWHPEMPAIFVGMLTICIYVSRPIVGEGLPSLDGYKEMK